MNKIKNIAFSALLAIGTFGVVTFTACTKDECKDVVCQNGGTCVSGACVCPTGYEGTNCETETRAKFIKSWSASDMAGTTPIVYNCSIAAGANISSVLISNSFSDNFFAGVINGTVSDNTLTVPSQKPDAGGNYSVQGSATYNLGKLTWTYTITKISTNETVNHTGTWQ